MYPLILFNQPCSFMKKINYIPSNMFYYEHNIQLQNMQNMGTPYLFIYFLL